MSTDAEFPRIVSVDDHVVEPAHLFERWLPAKFAAIGPKVERHELGGLKFVGGTRYEYELSDWPNTKKIAIDLMGHLPDDVIYKLTRGNAIRMLGLDLDRRR